MRKDKKMEDMKPNKSKITQILGEGIKLTHEVKINSSYKISKINEKIENNATALAIEKSSYKKISRYPQNRDGIKGPRKLIVTLFIFSLIIGGGYWISTIFEKADVVINVKKQLFVLKQSEFSASKNMNTPINFEIMIITDEEFKSLVLSESQNISTKATGSVVIYNEYSTRSQAVAKHSYLSDKNGKTYLTDKAITIAGYKTVNGKIIPGTASVGVTSFLAGSAYNIPPSDFNINIYKGTIKYTKIYAKSTTPISGGSQGLTYILSTQDKGALNAEALSTFKSNFFKKINAEIPKGYILYPNAATYEYKIDDSVFSPTPDIKVRITGTLKAIIFKESDLSKTVLKYLLPDISVNELNEIQIPNLSRISFAFSKSDQVITKEMQNVNFTLTGDLDAFWNPDMEKLKSSIAGASKNLLQPIFKSDPGIAAASVKIFPVWQSSMPEDLSRIHIQVQ